MRSAFVFGVFILASAAPAAAEDANALAQFYAGKTVTISVGFSSGGIFDLYARILARHMGQHIPGKPAVIVQNLPGAGGRRLANLFQKVGPHDGTAIGITTPGIVTDQVMQAEGVQYDLRKFHWVGSPADEVNVLWVWHTTPVKTLADVREREVPLSSTGHGSPNYFVPRILNQLIGTKFKVITGYPGATEADLAIERGEVSGRVSGWTGLKTTSDWVATGKVNVLVQQGLRKAPELKDRPLLPDVGTNERDKLVLDFLSLVPALGRPFFMPPGTPPERVAAIRQAFELTMKDAGFLAEAAKGQLDVAPLSGDDVAGHRDAKLRGIAGRACDRQEGDGVKMITRGAIDCDIHPAVPNTEALLPYLDDYWRDQIVNRHIHKQSFHLQSYPPNSPLSCRPDWRPKDGPPGQRSRSLARADARRLRLKHRDLQHAAWRDLAVQRRHGVGADLGGQRLHRQGMARPRAAAARVDPLAAAQSGARREGDRAARARQALRAGADAGHGRDAARAARLLADLRGVRAARPHGRRARRQHLPHLADRRRLAVLSGRGLHRAERQLREPAH